MCDPSQYFITQIYSREPPFADVERDYQIMGKIMKEARPPRPRLPDGSYVSDNIWSLMTSAWAHQPSQRPPLNAIIQSLSSIVHDSSARHTALNATENDKNERETSFPAPQAASAVAVEDETEVELVRNQLKKLHSEIEVLQSSETLVDAPMTAAESAVQLPPPSHVQAEANDLVQILDKMDPCSSGYAWIDRPDEGGFRCEGGGHFKSYAEAKALTSAPQAPSAQSPPSSNAPSIKAETKDQVLEKMDPCSDGYVWVDMPDEGGFMCEDGKHFKSYAEAGVRPEPQAELHVEKQDLLQELERMGICGGNLPWIDKPDEGGFVCAGGGHFVPYTQIRKFAAAKKN